MCRITKKWNYSFLVNQKVFFNHVNNQMHMTQLIKTIFDILHTIIEMDPFSELILSQNDFDWTSVPFYGFCR